MVTDNSNGVLHALKVVSPGLKWGDNCQQFLITGDIITLSWVYFLGEEGEWMLVTPFHWGVILTTFCLGGYLSEGKST